MKLTNKTLLGKIVAMALLVGHTVEHQPKEYNDLPQWKPDIKGTGKVNGKRKRNPNRWK